MTVAVFVAGGLALVVGGLLGLDWYVAGRARKPANVGARDQQLTTTDDDLEVTQRKTQTSRTRGRTEP